MSQAIGRVSEAVVHEVARATDRDALELPPLCDAVDPDALDAFVSGMDRGAATFSYAGQSVTVFPDETIDVDDHPGVRDADPLTARTD